MADYSLALGVKPLQLEDPLTAYSKFAAIQNAQNQNALAQYQMASARRAEEQQNALYEQAQMPGFKLDFSNALRYGAPGLAAYKAQREAETQGLQAQELRGKIAAQPGAMAKTEAETARFNQQVVEGQTKALGLGLMQAMQNPDDTTLNSIFNRLDATGVNTKSIREQFAAIPNLKAREQVIKQYALGNEEGRKALEFVSPKPQTFNLGGKEVSYDMNPNSPTYKQEILSQAKTLTPGESKPTVSQVDVGDRVLTQSYDPATRKITVLEERPKGLTPGESKPTVSQVDVGDRVLTQSYDPATRKITVLEERPKGLTPGESRPQLSTVDLGGTVATRLFDPTTSEVTQVSEDKKTLSPRAPHYISSPQGVMAVDPITQKPTPVLINGKPLLDSSTVNGQEQLKIARQRLNLSAQAERRLQEEADSSGGLSPQALDIAAQMVIQSGVMPPLGSGKNASLARVQVMNRVAEMTGTNAATGASNIISNQQDTLAAKAALKDFTSGVSARRVASNNTAINHLETMDSLATDLNNKDIRIFNAAGNAFATATGQPAPTSFDAAKQLVAAEVIKAVVNNGGGVTERQEAAENFSRANSPQQLKSVINTYRVLLGGQLESLENQYKAGTKRDDFRTTFLTPNTRKVLPPEPAKPAARNSGGVDLSNPLLK